MLFTQSTLRKQKKKAAVNSQYFCGSTYIQTEVVSSDNKLDDVTKQLSVSGAENLLRITMSVSNDKRQ